MTSQTNGVSLGRQALRRDVNTRISAVGAGDGTQTVVVFCECGRRRCADRIRIETRGYQEILASAARFVVTAGHEEVEAEELVGRHDGYVVVERKARR
jgi:hypothetical protein